MKKFIAIVFVIALLGVSATALFHAMVCNATSINGESHAYYVYPATPIDSVFAQLEGDYRIHSWMNLHLMAQYKKLTIPKPGYYRFPARISSRSLVNHLRAGWQTPVRLSFTNQIRNREQLAARLDKALLLDSAEVMRYLDNPEQLEQYGMNRATVMCLFIPNTYEVYWTISIEELMNRMYAEYRRFWNEERMQKAKAKGLTPEQVATLASIVESETNLKDEHPLIASLYLNRLRKGMPLQACPTAIYASGNFSTHRVTNQMLHIDSPYNTYTHRGLPPGPIRLASGNGIDAVLNAPKTDYLYMCANPDWSGTHVFSTSFAQHSRVGAAYHRELNRRGIRK